MTSEGGPNIAYSGLVMYLDPANFRSYDSRENLFQYSQDLSNAYWTKSGTTITANSGIAPDGTNTANLVASTNSGNAYFERSSAVADTSTYTYSAYVRGIGSSVGKTIVFGNYNNDTPRQNTSFVLTQEWQRISATFTPTQTVNNNLYIHTINLGATLTTSDTFLIWGAQLEKSSAPSIYTPTTNSTVTRSTSLVNIASSGNNSTLTNGPLFNSLNQGSISFNGGSSFSITDNNMSFGNNATWEAWVNRTSSVNPYNMFMGRYLPYFGVRPGEFIFSNYINSVQRTIYSTGITPSNNVWYHLVFTTSYDGTANTTMSMYINGALNISSAFPGTQNEYAYKFVLGDGASSQATTVPWYPFNGRISGVKIYNRTLSTTEVLQNYNATKSRYGL